MAKTFKIEGNDISDGYHTFGELYDHRCLIFIAFIQICPHSGVFFWKPHYDGWFVVYADLPTGQISYHLPNKYLRLVEKYAKRDDNYVWDGHTSNQVLERLSKLIEVK